MTRRLAGQDVLPQEMRVPKGLSKPMDTGSGSYPDFTLGLTNTSKSLLYKLVYVNCFTLPTGSADFHKAETRGSFVLLFHAGGEPLLLYNILVQNYL